MKILSILAFVALAVHSTLAEPERHLLRAGYDNPINFSDLPGLTHTTTDSTDSLPSAKGTNIAKNVVPTDLTTTAGRSGLNSLTDGSGLGSITNSVGKTGKLPSLPTSGAGGMTKGVPSVTDKVPSLTDGLGLPSPSTSGNKKAYESTTTNEVGLQSEGRRLESPKNLYPTPKSNQKKTSKTSAKKSPKPNVKPTPKPDPGQSPFQHSV